MQIITQKSSTICPNIGVKAGTVSNKSAHNFLRAGVQPKLKIGAVNDPAEVEADRVADQVMRMPALAKDGAKISAKAKPSDISRKCTDCGNEEIFNAKKPQTSG